MPRERQLTTAEHGHLLTNCNVWSPDGQWIVYDVRSDPAGSVFDGRRIERVHVESDQVEVLYESPAGSHVGVVTYHPTDERVIFIHGPENPTADWQYAAYHRRGVIAETSNPGIAKTVDACNLTPLLESGALRGGSHVHVWEPAGDWISFTYEDHLLATADRTANPDCELNQRNIGISVPCPIRVDNDHLRNHDGTHFSCLVTRTHDQPIPGSDEISRACEEGWIGRAGYSTTDGSLQKRALAFQGRVTASDGREHDEVFAVELPADLTIMSDGPLAGTMTTRPRPPRGTIQRRLTFTEERKHRGIQGVRHWLRSSPDGKRIAFLMRDDAGVSQLWTISPRGGEPVQLTRHDFDIGSAFTWSPDGRWLTYALAGDVALTDTLTGATRIITSTADGQGPVRPEACVFSPDGRRIAYLRQFFGESAAWNQIFVAEINDLL
jgi:hypothetical protein